MLLFYPQALVLDCLIHWAWGHKIILKRHLDVSNVIILSPGLGSGLSIHWAGVIDELNSLYVSNVIILSPGLGSGLPHTLGLGSLMSLIVYMSLMLLFYPQALVLDCPYTGPGVIDELNSLHVY